ncbi:MAG: hypothetical protein JWL84_3012 [Rhodospirillales bacterium]|nr:hypothetical protein [Rhodospirillales bacterium]
MRRSGCHPSRRGRWRSRSSSGSSTGVAIRDFSFEEIKIHIDTPEQVFAEYQINHRSGISGKDARQQFFGHLQADGGKIAQFREAIDVVVAAEAIYPNGLADVLAKRS